MYPPDYPRRRPLAPDLSPPPVITASFGSAPQLPALPASGPISPPPGIDTAQIQGIAKGVMNRFFKPKIGAAGAGLAGAINGSGARAGMMGAKG